MMNERTAFDEVTECLQGVSFPCSQDELATYCDYHGGTPEAVETLQNAPRQDYKDLDDLIYEIQPYFINRGENYWLDLP